jgi:hypothetical protein
MAWGHVHRSFARVTARDFGAIFTRRVLAILAVVSTTLCLASVAALATLVLRSPAHRPASVVALSARPWLSPLSIKIERAPLRSDGKSRITITLNYVNVGADPARGVVIKMRSGTVPQAEPVSPATLDAVYAGDNTTCDSLISPEKGGMVFPSSTVARSFTQTDIMASEQMITNFEGVLVVQACLKYQSANGAIHMTKLCEYVEPETDRPLDQRRLRACADGNAAN